MLLGMCYHCYFTNGILRLMVIWLNNSPMWDLNIHFCFGSFRNPLLSVLQNTEQKGIVVNHTKMLHQTKRCIKCHI